MKNDQDIKSKLENVEKILKDEITSSDCLELNNHLGKAIQQLKSAYDYLLEKDAIINTVEKQLTESEERYSRIISGISDYVYTVKVNNGKVTATVHNENCLSVTGYTSEELYNDSNLWINMIVPEDRGWVADRFTRLLNGEDLHSIEHRIVCKGGEIKWISDKLIPKHNDKGKLLEYDGIIKDITEKKKADKALIESEEKLRFLFENMTQGVVFHNPDGKIIYANQSSADILGLTLDQLFGKTAFDPRWRSIHEDGSDYPGETHPVMITLKTGKAVRNSIMGVYNPVSNAYRWININSTPKHKSNSESIELVVVTIEDITFLKHAEETLKLRESYLTSIIENQPGLMWLKDKQSVFLAVNKTFAKACGLEQPELLTGKTDFDIWPEELAKKYRADDAEVMANRKPKVVEEPIAEKGVIKWFETFKTPVFDSHWEIIGTTGYSRDITDRKLAEKAVRESQDRLQSIFRVAPTGIGVVRERIIQEVNTHLCEMTGYTPEELIGKSARIFYPNQEEFEFVGREKYKQIAEKGTGIVETKWIKKDGSILDILLASTPIDTKDQLKGVTFTALDLTERKRAEEILRNSEERFRLLFQHSASGIVVVSKNFKFLQVNEAFCKMTGYTETELQEKTFQDITFPEDRQVGGDIVQKVISGEMESFHLEKRYVHKNGTIIWGLVSSALIRDSQKKPLHFVTQIQDITERKHAEESLKESETLYRKMNENSPLGMHFYKLTSDNQLIFEGANPAADTILKVDNSQFIGKTIEEAFPSLVQTEVPDRYREAAKNGNSWSTEQVEYADEKIVGAYEVKAFQTIPGRIVAIFEDITKRKQTEHQLRENTEQIEAQNEEYLQLNEELVQTNEELLKAKERAEESDRLKTSFLQNMSHEIRTPMNAIMGFSELLVQHYNNKEKLDRYSQIINQRCNDLLEIINDILDIAKIESGQLHINNEYCNINNLFEELSLFYSEFKSRVGKSDVNFKMVNQCKSTENIVITDKGKLKQILINLISNAFKFTDKGVIEAGCKYDSKGQLLFYVSDTGMGIPENKQQTIFERFIQLNQAKIKYMVARDWDYL
jgi:PAS domain S-box-containing protein